jgi:tetratricopeptide (TPR) repeat protein
MKRVFSPVLRLLTGYAALAAVCLAMTPAVLAQGSNQERSKQQPRRPLPKPVAGSRGFEKYAGRDASSRLIAGAATREALDPAAPAYARGDADYAAGKYKEAVEQFSDAVRLRPDWVQAHYALALSLTETEELKEAIEEFKQVLKLNAKEELKILSYYNMGNAYADLGEYKEAIESYKEAIKLKPELSKPHNNLGLAYAALDRLAEAVAEFNEAVQLRPDYADAHFNLGVAYLQSCKKHESEEQQRILVKLNPELAAKLDALIKK